MSVGNLRWKVSFWSNSFHDQYFLSWILMQEPTGLNGNHDANYQHQPQCFNSNKNIQRNNDSPPTISSNSSFNSPQNYWGSVQGIDQWQRNQPMDVWRNHENVNNLNQTQIQNHLKNIYSMLHQIQQHCLESNFEKFLNLISNQYQQVPPASVLIPPHYQQRMVQNMPTISQRDLLMLHIQKITQNARLRKQNEKFTSFINLD